MGLLGFVDKVVEKGPSLGGWMVVGCPSRVPLSNCAAMSDTAEVRAELK